jgi:hypothetical protein
LLKLWAFVCAISETDGNSRFRGAETRADAENASELEPTSKSLDIVRGDEVGLVEGGGRETSWGREKRERDRRDREELRVI